VQIDANGTIYINGEELEESYGREVIKEPGIAAEPITLGEESILYWEITGMPAQTAGIRVLEILSGKISSEEHGFEFIHFPDLDLLSTSKRQRRKV